jgi:hypothetical protein
MRTLRFSRKVIIAVVAISVIASAAAAVTLFTQTFPAVPTQPQAIIIGTCGSNLQSESVPVSGFAGSVLFDCNTTATGQAFTTLPAANCPAPPAPCVAVTPTFTLPAPYIGLSLVTHSSGATSCTPFIQLTSGSFVTIGPLAISALAPGAPWDYCATFTSVPSNGLSTFSISWSQG